MCGVLQIEAIQDCFDKAADGEEMTDEQWTKSATVHAGDWQVLDAKMIMMMI